MSAFPATRSVRRARDARSRASPPSRPPTFRKSSPCSPTLSDLLRSAGRHRRSAHPSRRRRARLQSAHAGANSRHDPHARRVGGRPDRAESLAHELAGAIARARENAARLRQRPRVYFEEWDDPMISGIGWVSELIDAAGGLDIFADRAGVQVGQGSHRERRRNHPPRAGDYHRVMVRQKISSGESRRADRASIARRRCRRMPVHEIKSSLILQPGPAALTDGLAALQSIISEFSAEFSTEVSGEFFPDRPSLGHDG